MIDRALRFQHRVTGESFFATMRRYFIFLIGGGTGWLILIGIHTYLLGKGFHPAISYGAGDIFAVIFTFIYHIFVTFKIKTDLQSRFVKFAVLTTALAITNWGLFVIGRTVFDLPVADVIMSFFITGVLSVVNFLINRAIIFRNH